MCWNARCWKIAVIVNDCGAECRNHGKDVILIHYEFFAENMLLFQFLLRQTGPSIMAQRCRGAATWQILKKLMSNFFSYIVFITRVHDKSVSVIIRPQNKVQVIQKINVQVI